MELNILEEEFETVLHAVTSLIALWSQQNSNTMKVLIHNHHCSFK